MSNDPAAGDGVPDPVREWLSGIAREQDLSEQDLLGRLLSDGRSGKLDDATVDAEELADRVGELEAAVRELDAELDEKIEDVRERVIQVKRESDAKASRDHDHPELIDGFDRLGEQLDALGRDFVDVDASVDELDERIGAVDDRLERGFSNFEEILEFLVERTDDLQERIQTLAEATLAIRKRAARLAVADARRDAADGLRRTAHDRGITVATCETCDQTVHLGLLAGPDCPHCDARFTELEPRRGFFRSSVLHTGERPALEGEIEGESPDLETLLTGDDPVPPSPGEATPDGSRSASSRGTDGPSSTGVGSERAPTGVEPDGSEGSAAPTAPDTSEAKDTPDAPAAQDLDVISGIGAAYASRLRAAGVENVGALALADPDRLAARTDIAPGRVEKLVERARTLVESE